MGHDFRIFCDVAKKLFSPKIKCNRRSFLGLVQTNENAFFINYLLCLEKRSSVCSFYLMLQLFYCVYIMIHLHTVYHVTEAKKIC